MQFKTGDRVQIKSEYRGLSKLGSRGQIGEISYIDDNEEYVAVHWGERCTLVSKNHLTWHKQTKQHMPPKQYGNCYSICLAHVLGVPLSILPKFENMFDKKYNWSSILAAWLLEYDVTIIEMKGHVQCSFPYIVSGPSPNYPEVNHCVVYQDGKMIFDPAHSNKGVLSEDYTTFFADISHLKKVIREKYEKRILNVR